MTPETPNPPLYGLPDAEYLLNTPEAVVEREFDGSPERLFDVEFVVEEWSATGLADFVPSADDTLRWIAEKMCEEDMIAWEEAHNDVHEAVASPVAREAMENALDHLRSDLTPAFRFADRPIGKIHFIVHPDNTFERKPGNVALDEIVGQP